MAKAKELFRKFYDTKDKKAHEDYEGLCQHEQQRFCDKFKVHLNFYYTEPYKELYQLIDEVKAKCDNAKVMNLIRIPLDNNRFHVLLIKDVSKLSVLRICPHCREFVFDSKKDKFKLDRFNQHMEECKKANGKIIKDVRLKNVQLPYVPHLQNQKIYEFLYANKLEQHFKPTQYYLTYDFETLNYLRPDDGKCYQIQLN